MKSPRIRIPALIFLFAAALLLISACVPKAGAVASAGGGPVTGALPVVQGQTTGEPSGITVQGQGSASASPDLADIWLGVTAKAQTVTEAQSDASARMSKVMDSLTGMGVSKDQISTVRYTIYPQYDQTQALTGYEVDNVISVKTAAVDKVGELLDAAVAAGANRVEQVSFTVADPKPLASQARDAAMADAKDKATQLAKLAGVTLGQPTSIIESSGTTAPPQGMGGVAPATAAPPISPGETKIQVNVQVTYSIQ